MMAVDLLVYRIDKSVSGKKDIYRIMRPDETVVNENKHTSYRSAKKHLDLLIIFGYCSGAGRAA